VTQQAVKMCIDLRCSLAGPLHGQIPELGYRDMSHRTPARHVPYKQSKVWLGCRAGVSVMSRLTASISWISLADLLPGSCGLDAGRAWLGSSRVGWRHISHAPGAGWFRNFFLPRMFTQEVIQSTSSVRVGGEAFGVVLGIPQLRLDPEAPELEVGWPANSAVEAR